MSQKSANNLMQVYEMSLKAKLVNFTNLHGSSLYLLAAPSTPAGCPWLKREFGWSHDTALNFIRVYEMDGKFRSSRRRR